MENVNPAPLPVDQTARCRDDGAGPPGQWAARQPRATVRTENIRNHVAPSPAAAAATSPGPPPGSWPAEPPPAYPGMGPVYLVQPMGTPVAVIYQMERPPKDYLVLSLLTCLCCNGCCPIGLAAVYYSWLSRNAKNQHDFERARTYGETAKKLCLVTALVFAIFTIILIFLVDRERKPT